MSPSSRDQRLLVYIEIGCHPAGVRVFVSFRLSSKVQATRWRLPSPPSPSLERLWPLSSSPSLSRPPQPLCLEEICAGARPFFTPRESPLVVGRSPVDPVPRFAVPFPMKPFRYPNFARKCFLKSRTNLGDCGPRMLRSSATIRQSSS